jgi:type IV pilus assembly protein PilF
MTAVFVRGGVARRAEGPAARAAVALLALALLAGCAAPGQQSDGDPKSSDRIVPGAVVPASMEESDDRRRARIRVELAANYYQQRDYKVALDELGQALRADPEYAPAYGLLGLVYMDVGDRPRAEESFQRALRLAPKDADLNNSYGWFLCQTGREREAIDRFELALRDPLYATPSKSLHNAGICSMRIGDEAAAEKYFLRAFQADASNAVAMYNLGEIYLKRRELERARFHSQRLLDTYQPSPQTLWLALRVERALGNRDDAARLGAQLRRRFPDSPETALLAAGRYGD